MKPFSNGGWAVNVRTVGSLITELQCLPHDTPVRIGFSDSADLVLFNRKDDPHVSLEEGGDWCEIDED